MKNTNILFIIPPFSYNKKHITRAAIILPLGVAALASYVREHLPDVNIEILDAHALDLSLEEIMKKVEEKKRDVIGLSYWTSQAPNAYKISDALLEKNNAIIVHGGVHATSCVEEALEHADYVVMHEGERTFTEFLEGIRKNQPVEEIKGIAYKKGEEIRKNPAREWIEDLDEIPFPALDLLQLDRYLTLVGENIMHVVGGVRLPIMASRGCPYNCSYCVSPFLYDRKVRWRSPENVVEEIKKWMHEYGVNQFHFWDDNLMLNPNWVKRFCELIIENNLSIRWTGLTRTSHINKHAELLRIMKESGCVGIEIGVESTNPETLEEIHKNQTVSMIEKAILNQKNVGLTPIYTSMSFNPGETIEGYYVHAKFMNKHFNESRFKRLYNGQFATPYPKTGFFERAEELGMVLSDGWGDHFHFCVNFLPNSLLNDVPKATLKRLSISGNILTTFQAVLCRYSAFPYDDSLCKRMRKIVRHFRLLNAYYKLCTGKLTVRGIGEQILYKFCIDFKESMRFTGFATLELAQMGLIKSANSKVEVERIDRSCFIFYTIALFKILLQRSPIYKILPQFMRRSKLLTIGQV